MNKLYVARIVLFVILGVNLTNSSPLERLKRSLQSQSACPPGVWTCLTEKRNKMLSQPQRSIPQPAKLNSEASAAAACPPGVWTCLVSNAPAAEKMAVEPQRDSSAAGLGQGVKEQRDQVKEQGDQVKEQRDQVKEQRDQPITNDNDEEHELEEDPGKCPPGIWVCKKKRMLKRMLKQGARRVQRSTQKCPPGIWVC